MKILLIAPPPVRIGCNISGVYPLPPLGLACIASVLEKNSFDVTILDMVALNIRVKDAGGFIQGYDVYGISCNIFNLNNGIELSKIIKDKEPSSTVILGGRCTVFPAEIILRRFQSIDFVIRGEGEKPMLELCHSLRNKKESASISGLSYRKGDSVVDNPVGPLLDLDKMPFPARHLLPNKSYRLHPPFGLYPPSTLIETSRGCNYGCVFCGLKREVRGRSVGNIMQEVKEVVGALKVREIHFIDPNFTYDEERAVKLCDRLIEERINIHWTCKTRVDLVSKRLLQAMSKAGCYMISFGVESGSQKILDNLTKGIDKEDTESAFRLAKQSHIRTLAYVLFGAPGETKETVLETVDFVQKIDPDFVLYGELLPCPDSPLVTENVENRQGYAEQLFDFYTDNRHPVFTKHSMCGLKQKEVRHWLNYANAKFYLRITYMLKRALSLKNLNEMAVLIRGAAFLIRDKMLEIIIKRENDRYPVDTPA